MPLPARPPNSRSNGFTLFELIAAISIIGIFSAILLDRMLYYQEQAEKSAMVQTVGIVRSGLHLKLAELISHGKIREIAKLVDANPMDWLAEKPPNYRGEFEFPSLEQIPPGSWYFDSKNHFLVYIVDRDSHFAPEEEGRKTLRFKLKLLYGPASREGSPLEIEGLLLVPLDSYHWF